MKEQKLNTAKYRLSLNKFSSGKSTFNLSKVKKTAFAHLKAAKLRKYANLCKAEGIESNRVHIGPKVIDDSTKHNQKFKEKVIAPYSKEIKEAKKRETQQQLRLQEVAHKEVTHKEKAKDREKRRKALLRQFQSKKPNVGRQANKLLEKIITSTVKGAK